MRRTALIAIFILPLLFILLSPVYSYAEEDDYFSDETSDVLDELDDLLDDEFDLDNIGLDEQEDLFDEVEDIMEERSIKYSDEEDEEFVDEEGDEHIDVDRYVRMIQVKGGCFKMGDNFGSGHYDEQPVHKVCVDDFAIAEAEVTQEFWREVTGMNPSSSKGDKKPVDFVSWSDVQVFIGQLNEMTGRHFRLPTEAEWEYAARGRGKLEEWPGTNDEDDLMEYAWFDFTSINKTHPVKEKDPNLLGIYDLSGNVWEWVYDNYDMGYYKESPMSNPEGPEFAVWRGLRGGSFVDDPRKVRSSGRYGSVSNRRASNFGFRLAE